MKKVMWSNETTGSVWRRKDAELHPWNTKIPVKDVRRSPTSMPVHLSSTTLSCPGMQPKPKRPEILQRWTPKSFWLSVEPGEKTLKVKVCSTSPWGFCVKLMFLSPKTHTLHMQVPLFNTDKAYRHVRLGRCVGLCSLDVHLSVSYNAIYQGLAAQVIHAACQQPCGTAFTSWNDPHFHRKNKCIVGV